MFKYIITDQNDKSYEASWGLFHDKTFQWGKNVTNETSGFKEPNPGWFNYFDSPE